MKYQIGQRFVARHNYILLELISINEYAKLYTVRCLQSDNEYWLETEESQLGLFNMNYLVYLEGQHKPN